MDHMIVNVTLCVKDHRRTLLPSPVRLPNINMLRKLFVLNRRHSMSGYEVTFN